MKLKRINHLFRAYLIENKKLLLIYCLVVFVAGALDLTLNEWQEFSPPIAGCIPFLMAGRFFQSSVKRNNSTHFFNLPVSEGEKLVNAVVTVSIFTVIIQLLLFAGLYIGYYGLRPILNPVGSRYFTSELHVITFYIRFYWHYAAILFIFLFGSIYFKKNAFWKTLACGTAFVFGLALYIIFLLRIVAKKMINSPNTYVELGDYSSIGTNPIIAIVIIVFFLSLTYLRLKETEV